MPQDEEAQERTPLLDPRIAGLRDRRRSQHSPGEDAESIISSAVSKDEQALSSTAIGERLPYNDYTTIDWLHDLVCENKHVLLNPNSPF
jgi:chloride channel 3/4/5